LPEVALLLRVRGNTPVERRSCSAGARSTI